MQGEEDCIAPQILSFHSHLDLKNFTWITFAKIQECSGDIAEQFCLFPLCFRLLVLVSILPFQRGSQSQWSQPTSHPATRLEVATFHLEVVAGGTF